MNRILFLLLCLACSPAWATCERSDIEYYLEKGFTPEQITSLCSENAAQPAPAQAAVNTPVPAIKIPSTQTQEKLLASLSKVLKVESLKVEGGKLIFLQRFKAKFGERDVFGNFQEVKPSMQVAIELSSMRLIRTAKRIPIIRGAYVMLSGDVHQSLLNPEQYSDKQLAGITDFLAEEVGQNTVKIKVHRDADVDVVGADLQELSLLYRPR